MAGLVLEARGSFQSLQLIQDSIGDEAKVKPSLVSAGVRRFAIENAHVTIFHNCSSESSSIVFVNYDGPCQPNHDRFERHLPRLTDPHPDGSFSHDKFVERSLQQVELIKDNYDENVDGNIRAVISFGTIYVANCNIREVSGFEFDSLFLNISKVGEANLDPVHPGGRGRRPRWRGQSRNVPQSNKQLSLLETRTLTVRNC